MAAYDRTQLEPFYKLFPELTPAQTEYVLLFSLGFAHKENARILERSPRTVEHQLNVAKIRLDLANTASLRSLVLTRLFFYACQKPIEQFFFKPTLS